MKILKVGAMMKHLIVGSLACALLAAPAYAGNDVEGEFKKFSNIVEAYTGSQVEDPFCNASICSGAIGDNVVDLMWPPNGWVKAGILPDRGRMDHNMLLCASVIEYVAGLGPDGSAMMAGRLAAEADNAGSAKIDIGAAEVRARKASSGMFECVGARKVPL
ncbi:hypothetical protein [Amorphus sp. MBR-141]